MRLCRATRAAADAEEKARAERAAKRAAAKTRETGDPETVKTWLDSKRVVHSPGHVLQGHSKNPSGYSFDGVVAIFPKVLASFGDREAALADHANCGVS